MKKNLFTILFCVGIMTANCSIIGMGPDLENPYSQPFIDYEKAGITQEEKICPVSKNPNIIIASIFTGVVGGLLGWLAYTVSIQSNGVHSVLGNQSFS